MKLIFLNRYFHPDVSATSQMLSSLAFHLAAEGAEVHVVTSRQCYDNPSAGLPSRQEIAGVRVHRVRTSGFGRGSLPGRALDYASFYVSATIGLAKLVRRGDIVISKTDPPVISFPASVLAHARGARLANWLQDLFPEIAERVGVRLLHTGGLARAARDFSLRNAALNVVIGERMRMRVQSIPGVAPVRVIHNWADGTRIVPIPREDNPAREAWGLSGKFVVSYSGNMGRAHEFETVLDSASALRGNEGVVFLFIGGGHHYHRLQDESRNRGLPNVRFQPYQPLEGLGASLCAGDVHLITPAPSMEGLVVPSKLYGILAAGRPAINVGDPSGEVAGILEAAKAGFTVPTGNPVLLTQRILECASNPALCANLGRNARLTFEQHFSEKIAFARWKEALLAVDQGALG